MSATTSAPTRARTTRSGDGQVVGVMLVALGVGWLLQRSGAVDVSWETLLSMLLVVLGVGMVMTARRPGGIGLVVLGGAMTLVLASTSSIDVGLLNEGVGDRALRPATVAQARTDGLLGIGDLDIDLTTLDVPPGRVTSLRYALAVGDLTVRVPADAVVSVRASVEGGELSVFGHVENGPDLQHESKDARWANDEEARLHLDLSVGIGSLRVERPPG